MVLTPVRRKTFSFDIIDTKFLYEMSDIMFSEKNWFFRPM